MNRRQLFFALLVFGALSTSFVLGQTHGNGGWPGGSDRSLSVPTTWGEIVSANKDGLDWGVVFRSPEGEVRLVSIRQNKRGFDHILIQRDLEQNR